MSRRRIAAEVVHRHVRCYIANGLGQIDEGYGMHIFVHASLLRNQERGF